MNHSVWQHGLHLKFTNTVSLSLLVFSACMHTPAAAPAPPTLKQSDCPLNVCLQGHKNPPPTKHPIMVIGAVPNAKYA